MSISSNLQSYFGKIEDAVIDVDLLKIGQSYGNNSDESTSKSNKKHNGKYRIALDMDNCLDRFYGGYFSDWACGGQWNRALQFVQLLANAFNSAHIEVVVFFDGTMKNKRILQSEQTEIRSKILSVLKHIRVIGTPPPKIWWLPPSGTKTFLRNALRSINIQVVQTVNDHTGEIINYYHEYKLNAIMGLNSDYLYSNISHYYSSHDLRLSYKGTLETKEFCMINFLKQNEITSDHLLYLAIFLNCKHNMIDENLLKQLYEKFNIDYNLDFEAKLKKFMELFKKNPFSDIDEFIKIHNLCDSSKIIKDIYTYYLTKYKGKKNILNNIIKHQKNEKNKNNSSANLTQTQPPQITSTVSSSSPSSPTNVSSTIDKTNDGKNENVKDEKVENGENKKKIENGKDKKERNGGGGDGDVLKNKVDKNKANTKAFIEAEKTFIYTLPGEVIKTALNRHQRGIMDSRIYHLLVKKEIVLPQILEDEQYREIPSINQFYRPARQMIYATLFNLYHQNYVCSKTFSHSNNNKKNKNNGNNRNFQPEVKIQEWVWRSQNEYKTAETVSAVSLPWAVPTVQRLWFGTGVEDKQRRMKAFLTIMRSDSPLMLNRSYVPQHMLVMACVLRYIITNPDREILSRPELDAFLATAFSLQLNNVEYTQELTLPGVNLRGIFLASIFTQGIETASLANDACGVPLPWIMTNPWLFFDGKLFHLKLKMSTYVQNLRQLCEDQIEIVMKIERFRKAILEGLEHNLMPNQDLLYRQAAFVHHNLAQQFSKPYATLSNIPSGNYYGNTSPPNYYQPANLQLPRNAGFLNRGGKLLNQRLSRLGNTTVGSLNHRGYQLKVGGIVVGSWADGVSNKPLSNNKRIMNLARNRYSNQRKRTTSNNLLNRSSVNGYQTNVTRTIGRHNVGGRQNRNRKNKKKSQAKKDAEAKKTENETEKIDTPKILKEKIKTVKRDSTVELQNGTTVLASDLANSICDELLRDEPSVHEDIIIESITDKIVILTDRSSENSPTNDPNKKTKNITWQQPLTEAGVVEESG